MAHESAVARYRKLYAKLLRLYSKPYRDRFGEGMEQTFNDLLRERTEEERGLFGYALWMFVETSAGIIGERKAIMIRGNKRLIGIVLAIAILLLIPLVAMLFTDEVDWGVGDFIVAGVLLVGAGLTYELIAGTTGNTAYRTAVGVAVAAALILVWMNLAVGIIGFEDNLANLMYIGVLAVGIIGATIARLQSHGMAHTLFAMAFAQALVAMIALIVGLGSTGPIWPWDILILTGLFVVLWVVSALLFRRASATGSKQNRQLE